MPDQSLVCGVRQHEPVVGTLKERREVRGLEEHAPEAANLLTAFEQFPGLSPRSSSGPFYRKAVHIFILESRLPF
jgi:hypothetical protein